MTNKEIFESAFNGYQVQADDNPDNVRYYRAWAAIKAVLARYGHNDPHECGLNVHYLMCNSIDWNTFVASLELVTPKNMPQKPNTPMFMACEPSAPNEKAIKTYFDSQYKAKWPENLINSKHYKEMFAKYEAQAKKHLENEYKQKLDEYKDKETVHSNKCFEILSAWKQECSRVEQAQILAKGIISQ